jgi:hypothetical protein
VELKRKKRHTNASAGESSILLECREWGAMLGGRGRDDC